LKSYFNKVILNENGPLSKVEQYFWRIEYQARGMPHIHMKLWIKYAHIDGKDSNENVLQFIKKIISCSIPKNNPE
jgi:hypothetical protein